MSDLGLGVPDSLFATQVIATQTITAMVSAVKTLGKSATIRELIGATTGLEKLQVVSALSAAGYVGAAIGSFAVATGRYLSCGSRIADAFAVAQQNGWMTGDLHQHLAFHPEITKPRAPGRSSYALRITCARRVVSA